MPPSSTYRRRRRQHRCCVWIVASAWLLAGALHARTLTLHADRLDASQAEAAGIDVTLREAPGRGTLRLDVRRLDLPILGLSGRLRWECALETSAGARRCGGPMYLDSDQATGESGRLDVGVAPDRIELDFARGDARVRIALPLGSGAPDTLELANIPAAWLRAPLAQAWPDGTLRGGTIGGTFDRRTDGTCEGRYALAGLSFEAGGMGFAGENLDATGSFRVDGTARVTGALADAKVMGGRLRLGDTRIELPDTPVALRLDLTADRDTWRIRDLAWSDPGTLEFSASGSYTPSAPTPLRDFDVRIARASLPAAIRRYASGVLAAHGWSGVSAKGDLSGELAFEGGAPARIVIDFDRIDLDDGERFSVRRLDGAFDWSAAGNRPPAALRWKSLRAGGLAFGAARMTLRSRGGAIELAEHASIPFARGTLDLRKISLDPRLSTHLDARADFALRKIGYDSADGTVAAAGVEAEATLRLDGTQQEPHLELRATLHGGEGLYGPFYVKLPQTPVTASIDARLADARWHIDRFEWIDPGVLEVDGTAEIAPAAARPMSALDLEVKRAALATAIDRYAHSWLASKGYDALSASGELTGSLAYDVAGPQRFRVDAKDMSVDDGAGRFRFTGVSGGVEWRYGEETAPTSLRWTSFDLFRIPFGAATAELQSKESAITLARPIAIGVLGGEVRLERLSLQPRSSRGERYAGSFAIAGIDMTQLSTALGWPRFGGNLSGGIPEIELSGDRIELHGGLDLYVFGGYLGVSGLTLERPFGVAPSLLADVHFENFDLDQLTSAFSFGGMTGRLDGTIGNLRLVDWSPVAFDAALRADRGGRMSYKAVDDLTALGGGGGLSSNLQTMALRMFDTFGYRRLGIRCKLVAEVCTMGGIEPFGEAATAGSGGDSYTIVEGSGLPRIRIIGHRRRVAWPTLVDRLVEATRGNGPVIQ